MPPVGASPLVRAVLSALRSLPHADPRRSVLYNITHTAHTTPTPTTRNRYRSMPLRTPARRHTVACRNTDGRTLRWRLFRAMASCHVNAPRPLPPPAHAAPTLIHPSAAQPPSFSPPARTTLIPPQTPTQNHQPQHPSRRETRRRRHGRLQANPDPAQRYCTRATAHRPARSRAPT